MPVARSAAKPRATDDPLAATYRPFGAPQIQAKGNGKDVCARRPGLPRSLAQGRRPVPSFNPQNHPGPAPQRRFGQPFRKPDRVGRRYGKAQRPAVGLHFDQQRAIPVRSYG
jgi:hypothetical protein